MERLAMVLFFWFCMTPVIGQGYIDQTSAWKGYHYQWGAGFSDKHATTEFQYSKDTIIDGKDYIELLYRRFDYHTELVGIQTDTVWSSEYIGKIYLREVDNKWYHREASADRLILDFNYEIGDTIHYDWYYNEYYIVQDIEEFEIGGETRKKFIIHLQYSRRFYVYEGIGSSRGFLYPFIDASFEGYRVLECYNYQGETFIVDSRAENCEIQIVSDIRESPKEWQAEIYPNPVKDVLNIEMKGGVGEQKIGLFDLNGKRLLEERMFDEVSTGSFQVDLGTLPQGIYILKIGNRFQGLTKKIVKL